MAKPNKPTALSPQNSAEARKDARNRGDDPGPGPTLAMDFLGNKSVKLMHTVLDDSSADPRSGSCASVTRWTRTARRLARNIKTIERLPPWEIDNDETSASA